MPKPRQAFEVSKRRLIYDYIVRYHIFHGFSPTIREIVEEAGVTPAASVVHHYLGQLVEEEKIKLRFGVCRGIQIVGSEWMPPITWIPKNEDEL